MPKRPAHHRVKVHEVYTIFEAASTLGVHRQTVTRWIKKSGLKAATGSKPWLIEGADLKSFLIARRKAGKRPLLDGEFFCLPCGVSFRRQTRLFFRRLARGLGRCGVGAALFLGLAGQTFGFGAGVRRLARFFGVRRRLGFGFSGAAFCFRLRPRCLFSRARLGLRLQAGLLGVCFRAATGRLTLESRGSEATLELENGNVVYIDMPGRTAGLLGGILCESGYTTQEQVVWAANP